jgi:phosphatidylinositol 4-kinase
LARELRFQVILFGLKVLRYSSAVSAITQWRMKDQILSAALNWFSFPPRWSFGSNRLQIKAEMKLLADVTVALHNVRNTGVTLKEPLKSLLPKEELLNVLLESEQARLAVWLMPLADARYGTSLGPKEPSEVSIGGF